MESIDEKTLSILEVMITQIVKKIMAEERASSVNLTMNSKGDVQPEVKQYAPSVAEAGAMCEAEFDRLRAKYRG